MRPAVRGTKEVAEHLIAHERAANKSDAAMLPEAFLVCEKLRPQLATLMGGTGFSALLSRALALASAEVRWLGALHVAPDGSFEGLVEARARVGSEEISEGGAVLLSQLLGLLITFVGEDLTLQLVYEVWPTLAGANLGFGKGRKNDK